MGVKLEVENVRRHVAAALSELITFMRLFDR